MRLVRRDVSVSQPAVRQARSECLRVVPAPALLLDAPVLIPNERPSASDAGIEALLPGLPAWPRHGRATVVRHRVSPIRDADRIIVLEAGRAAQTGSHHDLRRRAGPYAVALAVQRGGQPESNETGTSRQSRAVPLDPPWAGASGGADVG